MARVTVTGFTAARMLEIEQASVVSGTVQGDSLVLLTKGGNEIVAGNVRGPQGVKGDPGGVPDATNSTKGGVRLQGNLGGSAATPTITGALDGTVDASLANVTTPNPAGGNFTATLRQVFAAARVAVAKAGKTQTLWSGTLAEYSAIPEATRNAEGFVAVILE
ncbi:hypothetical protein HWC66_gp28 [Gordonia phage Chikenjars]|uniref:Minor tail protein n=2 Tax=Kenoshavirus TaxID=2842796 RepID=A0A410TCI8_9CAUD|nr:hypothetical protein HWC06_gp28 [Gordonia phage Duffington]YP_009852130.1 hypothetical protein HWC66_gp28 [Gordonia phage Chikenjars]QXO14052.1 hypothetical protein SEA_ALAINAMARIE_28 [Gordonia phage AlainaMarie]QYC53953.1 hypothetical protein SEA_NITHYA_28 [Gordonia phage Nithya]WNN94349.1 hypothetical protein SEA_ENDAVE_28 [Gordonia phage EndAve]QAU06734.1 hypothetical protein SEA_DUFFINGTON_28 [Gordonia phage Duffington]QEQ94331.1 hypothetical protein SEA_CHIKENJARS_28 [Gordonia phage C